MAFNVGDLIVFGFKGLDVSTETQKTIRKYGVSNIILFGPNHPNKNDNFSSKLQLIELTELVSLRIWVKKGYSSSHNLMSWFLAASIHLKGRSGEPQWRRLFRMWLWGVALRTCHWNIATESCTWLRLLEGGSSAVQNCAFIQADKFFTTKKLAIKYIISLASPKMLINLSVR